MSPKKETQASAKRKKSTGFTAEERAAMKERAQELKAAERKEDGEKALLAKVAEMPKADRSKAERLHALVKANAPDLVPKTWYGMPAYAKDDKVVCFFQSAAKFKSRYATLGFSDTAKPRRRRHVADHVRADGSDPRRGGEDRQALEEGRALDATYSLSTAATSETSIAS